MEKYWSYARTFNRSERGRQTIVVFDIYLKSKQQPFSPHRNRPSWKFHVLFTQKSASCVHIFTVIKLVAFIVENVRHNHRALPMVAFAVSVDCGAVVIKFIPISDCCRLSIGKWYMHTNSTIPASYILLKWKNILIEKYVPVWFCCLSLSVSLSYRISDFARGLIYIIAYTNSRMKFNKCRIIKKICCTSPLYISACSVYFPIAPFLYFGSFGSISCTE